MSQEPGDPIVPSAVKVRVSCATIEELERRFAAHVSRAGFYLPTRQPRPAGTALHFEVLLSTGARALCGSGVVERAVPPGDRTAPGMVIRFTALDAPSRALVERMAARRAHAAPRPAPVPAAPARDPASGAAAAPPSTPSTPAPTPPPTPAPARAVVTASPGPAQADLSAPHAVSTLGRGPASVELGLPAEPAPITRPSRLIIGIDLGTSNSCAAVVKDGKPYVIPSREGHNTVPSIVGFSSRRKLVVGHLARAQLLSAPRETIYGAKRLIGRRFESKAVQAIRNAFPYPIVPDAEGMAAVELGGRVVTLEQISALILREVKDVAQNHLGEEVNRAVITVPAYYSERQREAVRRAGALAGLQVERIVNEPTAAALAYAYGRRLRQRVLVYDLGGGTFDASILELQDNVYEVVSTGGDTFLGGADFDRKLVDRLLQTYAKQVGRPFDGDRVALSRLFDAAERAKCALSERQEERVQLPFIAQIEGTPVALETRIARNETAALVKPLVDRTLQVCREVLAARNLEPGDLDEVILVGGQSRMPLVQEQVQAFFGRAPSRAVHPDEAVAIGAALLAHTLRTAEGLVLIDVLPIAMGLAQPDGSVRRLFERNAPLPSRKQYALETTRDDQSHVEIAVVQGDGARVEDCEPVGTVRITGLPPGRRGTVKVGVVFELGAECLLTATARELATGKLVQATFTPDVAPVPEDAGTIFDLALKTAAHPLPPVPRAEEPAAPQRRGLLGRLRRALGSEAR